MLIESRNIVGYCCPYKNSSGDMVSVEEQKASIRDYVEKHFPGANLIMFEDHDSDETRLEKLEGYMEMKRELVCGRYDTVVVQSFFAFSRPDRRWLMAMEKLRDSFIRIISVEDGIDYPIADDWLTIQVWFLHSCNCISVERR